MLLIGLLPACRAGGKPSLDRLLLARLYGYPKLLAAGGNDTLTVGSYTKYSVLIDRKNATLMLLPPMFYLAKDGDRSFFFEFMGKLSLTPTDIINPRSQLMFTTLYKKRRLLGNINHYYMPRIYCETMVNGNILSPFVRANRRYYRLATYHQDDGTTLLVYRGKLRNTQLVRGTAMLDQRTGRVLSYKMEGEYDMVHFVCEGTMGSSGVASLYPCSSRLAAKINSFGNRLYFYGDHLLGHFRELPDDYHNRVDRQLMDSLRPMPLNQREREIISSHDSAQQASKPQAETKPKRRSWAKKVFWDIIGDNILNRIHANFGPESKGSLRVGPIFNPLYLGYSNSKGVVYKFDLRGRYTFNDNSDLSVRLKGGYSFKQRRLYYHIPVYYNFDRRHNGYVEIDFGNGNRITNSHILDEIKDYKRNDSIDWNSLHLEYFKDMNFGIEGHIDLGEHFGVKAGMVIHKRTAVNKQGYREAGRPVSYKSVAPLIELEYRPWGYAGRMTITADFEKGFKGLLGGELTYDRWELDAQWEKELGAMRQLSLRAGTGLYTSRGKDYYFLDFANFRENNLPGGWDDEWSGEFELLNSNWYNASKYYLRSNATYQSPCLVLSRVPLLGRIVEKERIYFSTLTVSKLNPYVEVGYGFTNRVFSMGVFTGFSPHNYEGVGVKFGFELFNNW